MGSFQGDDGGFNGDVACENLEVRSGLKVHGVTIDGVVHHDASLIGNGTPSSLLSVAAGVGATIPARTLFVALAWSPGVNPLVYFTSIAAALAQAATMAPTGAVPVAIVIYPGTYAAPLALVSNVHLMGVGGRRSPNITGAVTWTAGAGVNAAQAAVREEIDLVLVKLLGPLSIDTTAKTGDIGAFDARDSTFDATITFAARPGGVDFFQAWNGIFFGGLISFDNVNLNLFTSSTLGIACTSACAIDIRACEIFGATTLAAGASNGSIECTQINGIVDIGAGCALDFTGSRFQPGTVLTVAAGGAADVRTAEYESAAGLAGAGTINRSIDRSVFGPTALGPQVVPIAPPLPDGAYNVCLTQTAGAPQFPPFVTAKAGAGFTLTDSVGGGTFDVTILKE